MDLKNKIVTFLGDSITEGIGVQNVEENRYDNIIKKDFGLAKTYNMGISGTRFAHQVHVSNIPSQDLCFCGRVYFIPKDTDIIIVYGGVNDYNHGDAPFGQETDTTPASFCGAVYFLMRYLKKHYPDAQIVFLTPAHMVNDETDDLFPSRWEYKTSDAKPLVDYVEYIKKMGKQFEIPVLDLYHIPEIDAHDPKIKATLTADGTHFNDCGHHALAKIISDFLIQL